MKQYSSIKEKHKDCILMFRLGDFYEMFGDDAKTASKILQIALTSRDKSKEEPMPMCGIPHFASETYITKLIKAGHKVAICEQMEDAKEAKGTEKGIIQRDVVRVITPGTHTPEHPKENNYILSFSLTAKETASRQPMYPQESSLFMKRPSLLRMNSAGLNLRKFYIPTP